MPEKSITNKSKRRRPKRPANSLRQLLDFMSDGILLIDDQHNVLFANKAAKRLIGQAALHHKKLESLVILTAHNKEQRVNSATIPTTHPLSFHSPASDQIGTLTLISNSTLRSLSHLNGSTAAIAILKKLDDPSTATATPTTAYQEILGHLTLRIAHDFNNSLTAILGNAELVQDTLETISNGSTNPSPAQQAQTSLPVIQDFIRKLLEMATFIKKLQDYAKQQPRPKETLDINQTIIEIIPIAQRLLGRKVNLEFLPGDDLPQFYGEHAQIDQIIFSLLLNSKENMPTGGRVTIRTEQSELDQDFADNHAGSRPGNYIRLTVADTGSRIPESTLTQAFELFSTSTTHEGGLRLPTVYAIVKQLGGYIDVESWQGRGARFEIYLPLQIIKPSSQMAPIGPARKKSRPGPKIRKSLRNAQTRVPLILIAEDQDDIKRMMERAILKAGYEIITTSNGNDTLSEFETLVRNRRRPSLVISDLGLPGMDGRTLCKKLREAHPRTSLLLTSGYRIDLKENNSKTLDDFDFIQKPFESSTLITRIAQILKWELKQ